MFETFVCIVCLSILTVLWLLTPWGPLWPQGINSLNATCNILFYYLDLKKSDIVSLWWDFDKAYCGLSYESIISVGIIRWTVHIMLLFCFITSLSRCFVLFIVSPYPSYLGDMRCNSVGKYKHLIITPSPSSLLRCAVHCQWSMHINALQQTTWIIENIKARNKFWKTWIMFDANGIVDNSNCNISQLYNWAAFVKLGKDTQVFFN